MLRRFICVAVTLAGLVPLACDGQSAQPALDAGVSPGAGDGGILCAKDIAAGDPCPADGTTCLTAQCARTLLVCTSGSWREAARVFSLACPTSIPGEGQLCPACWPGNRCLYGDLVCSPGQNYTIALCASQKWTVTLGPCSTDAGVDLPDADAGDAPIDAPRDVREGG